MEFMGGKMTISLGKLRLWVTNLEFALKQAAIFNVDLLIDAHDESIGAGCGDHHDHDTGNKKLHFSFQRALQLSISHATVQVRVNSKSRNIQVQVIHKVSTSTLRTWHLYTKKKYIYK